MIAFSSPTDADLAEAGRLAEARLLGDLVDTLLAEGFLDDQPVDWPSPDTLPATQAWPPETRWLRWWTVRQVGEAVLIPLRSAILPSHRHVATAGVFAASYRADGTLATWRRLAPAELLEFVVKHCLDDVQRQQPGVANVRRLLSTTLWQTRQSIAEAAPLDMPLAHSAAASLRALERRAALRDRPFHPLAKAKEGLDEASHRCHAAEFAQTIRMRWLAMRRECLMTGSGATPSAPEPALLLLNEAQRAELDAEMARRGLSREAYLALPVHPWQFEHGLPRYLGDMLATGEGVALEIAIGDFGATSSLRSLAPLNESRFHLKLPMAVFSLGAARYLPAVKLLNGERGQTLLEQARERDPELQARLYLCDERRWWSYLPQGSGLFDDPPRHLGALAREYPASLLKDPSVRLVPMAALGVSSAQMARVGEHPFDAWRQQRGWSDTETAAIALFGEVCDTFFDIALRLYRLGLMPEIHGQNAVLVCRDGRLDGLLLRDHDSVRLHRPWLDRHGIDDPCYHIRPGYSNSLYNDTPQDLLFYLQTLGIQVNLLAIVESLTQHYAHLGLAEARLWHEMRIRLKARIAALPFDALQRRTLNAVLFEASRWPLKCMLRPLFEQQGVPGSMPSGKSSLPNPFHVMESNRQERDVTCVVGAEPV
ncbi:IucA/IucC family protein [Billgrantia diversa]|uniref:IucA/IucC family protein n=1 Tax=Halomonas sp. MCCC 1A13316 TaxID=2733487 RepID=UPI0018A4CB39|nr:IucA/IucC family protein [Halomonas sp. MCCC 1A13316]QOR38450.1 IucA/IucC family protein [Halomonas sp. MCCC 1A13316]